MKKMMLLIGGIVCFTVADVTAMMVVKTMKSTPKSRCISYHDGIYTIKCGNSLLIGWHHDRMKEQLLKRSAILNHGSILDLTDLKVLDEFAGALSLCELEIHRNCQKIEALRKENKKLDKKYRNWKRS